MEAIIYPTIYDAIKSSKINWWD